MCSARSRSRVMPPSPRALRGPGSPRPSSRTTPKPEATVDAAVSATRTWRCAGVAHHVGQALLGDAIERRARPLGVSASSHGASSRRFRRAGPSCAAANEVQRGASSALPGARGRRAPAGLSSRAIRRTSSSAWADGLARRAEPNRASPTPLMEGLLELRSITPVSHPWPTSSCSSRATRWRSCLLGLQREGGSLSRRSRSSRPSMSLNAVVSASTSASACADGQPAARLQRLDRAHRRGQPAQR